MKDSERAWRRAVHISWALVLVGCGMACAHDQPPLNPVVGVITPEYFRFRDIVASPEDPDDTGGWRAVCIHAQINQGNSRAKTICTQHPWPTALCVTFYQGRTQAK